MTQSATTLPLHLAIFNSLVLAVSRVYYLALRALYIFLLVKYIGVPRYGEYSYAQSWYLLLLPLATWGGNELLISGLLRRPPGAQEQFAGTALSLRILLCLGTGLLILCAAVLTEARDDLRLLMLIFSQGVLSRGLATWYSSMFTARGRSDQWVVISVCGTTVEVVLLLWLAAAGASLVMLAILQSAIWWILLLLTAYVYSVRHAWVHPRWQPAVARWFLRRGASVGLATFLLLCLTPGLLLVYRYVDPTLRELGTLALVLQAFLIFQQLLTLISNALLPALRAPTEDSSGNLVAFAAVAIKLSIYLGGALGLLLLAGVPQLLDVLPPTRFDAALRLLGAHAWILTPMLAVQALRLVFISSAAVDGFLVAVTCGVLAALGMLLAVAQYAGVDAADVVQAMGTGLCVVVAMQLLLYTFAAKLRIVLSLQLLLPLFVLLVMFVIWSAVDRLPAGVVFGTAAVFTYLALQQLRKLR